MLYVCRFGSERVKREFLAPSIAGDMVACLGVSEVGSGSDVASKRIFLNSFIIGCTCITNIHAIKQ